MYSAQCTYSCLICFGWPAGHEFCVEGFEMNSYIAAVMCTLCLHDNKVFQLVRFENAKIKWIKKTIKALGWFRWFLFHTSTFWSMPFAKFSSDAETLSCEYFIHFGKHKPVRCCLNNKRTFSGAIDHVKLQLLNVLLRPSISCPSTHNVNISACAHCTGLGCNKFTVFLSNSIHSIKVNFAKYFIRTINCDRNLFDLIEFMKNQFSSDCKILI